ncbi:hypothetical protein GCM10027577_34370 [Spirosoma fluminis]
MTVFNARLLHYPYSLIDQNRAFMQDWLYDELGLTIDRLMLLLIGFCIVMLSMLRLADRQSSSTC